MGLDDPVVSGEPPAGPWDPGLQNERTTLAWVRTALSLVALSILVARQSASGWVALALFAAAAVVAGWMISSSDDRHGQRQRALERGQHVVAAGPVAATAAAALVLAVGSLVIVLA